MEGIITIIILVITAIGWISNAMNEQKNKPRPGQKPQQRPRRKLQSEIENFLKEVQQQQGPEKAKPQPTQDSPPTRPQFQAKAQEKPQRRKEKRKKPNVNKSVSQPLAHLNPTAALPDSFNRHKDKAKPRESVFVVPKKAEYKKPASKGNFVALLHVPGNVQNAIIMSEILQPPLALRNRKSSR